MRPPTVVGCRAGTRRTYYSSKRTLVETPPRAVRRRDASHPSPAGLAFFGASDRRSRGSEHRPCARLKRATRRDRSVLQGTGWKFFQDRSAAVHQRREGVVNDGQPAGFGKTANPLPGATPASIVRSAAQLAEPLSDRQARLEGS